MMFIKFFSTPNDMHGMELNKISKTLFGCTVIY
jgi:hypothetical protein